MKVVKVIELEVLSGATPRSPRQLLSAELHRTSIWQRTRGRSQENRTVLMQLKPAEVCRAVSLSGWIAQVSTTAAAKFNLP